MNRFRKFIASLTVFLLIFGNMSFAQACHYNFNFAKVDDTGASMSAANFPSIRFSLEMADNPTGDDPSAWAWKAIKKGGDDFKIGDSTGQVALSGTVYFRTKEVQGAAGYSMQSGYQYFFIRQYNTTPTDITVGGITFQYVNDNTTKTIKFTNKKLGALTVSKAFPAGSLGNANETFAFSVTREGDATNLAAGKAIKATESFKLTDLAWGTYTIKEIAKDGYVIKGWNGGSPVDAGDATKGVTVVIGRDSGATLDACVTATNDTDNSGKITIKKVFAAGSHGNTAQAFTFSVVRDVDGKDYAAGKSVTAGKSFDLDNLPWGTYTIKETSIDGNYTLASLSGGTLVDSSDLSKGTKVTIGPGSDGVTHMSFTITATNNTKDNGQLTIVKAFPAGSLGNTGDTFSFKVTRDGDSKDYAAGQTVAAGSSMVLSNLPWGTYTITENAKNGYKLAGWAKDGANVSGSSVTANVGSGADAKLAYVLTATNDTDNVGSIKITKAFPAGSLGNAKDSFSFSVIRDADGKDYGAGKTVTAGNTLELTSLPWGTYTITENAKTGYHLTGWTKDGTAVSGTSVAVKIGTGSDAKLAFQLGATNDTSNVGKITISKVFPAGSLGDTSKTFSFSVTRDGGDGTNYAAGKTVTAGNSLQLTDLPWGTYTVKEISIDNNYTLTGLSGGTLVNSADLSQGTKVTIGTGSDSATHLEFTVTATNSTKNNGKLSIAKAFPAGSLGNTSDTFSFTVKRAGDSTNYGAGKTVTAGNTLNLDNLPWGVYTVTEDSKAGYQLTKWSVDGVETTDASVTVKIGDRTDYKLSYALAATNDTTNVGAIDITKAFAKGSEGNPDDAFSFVVTRDGGDGTNYAAGQTIKVGGTMHIGNLPWGTYTITEDAKSGYQLTGWTKDGAAVSGNSISVTIGTATPAKLAFQLTAINKTDDIGKIDIKKLFPAGSLGNADDTFSFSVIRQGGDGTDFAAGKTIKAGETMNLTNLPWGTYTITENAKTGYQLTGWTKDGTALTGNSVTVKIGTSADAKLAFALAATNDTAAVGKLDIKKLFPTGSLGNPNDTFSFSVIRNGGDGTDFAAGKTIKAGETLSLTSLPWGTYTITENAKTGYQLTGWTKDGTAVTGATVTVKIGTTADAKLAFALAATNDTSAVGELDITKYFPTNSLGNPNDTFSFTVTRNGGDGTNYADGKTIKAGETLKLTKLPWGTYTITENAKDGYQLTGWTKDGAAVLGNSVSVKIGTSADAKLLFALAATNDTANVGKIAIAKTVDGLQAGDTDTFQFSIIRDGDTKDYGAGKTVAAGGTLQLDNLPWGTYTIAEVSKTGYKLNSWQGGTAVDASDVTKGVKVTIGTAAGSSLSFQVNATNRKLGSLKLTKTVQGAPADDTTKFTLTVTGPNGFTQDVELANNGTATLTNLDWGTYTVVEKSIPDGYESVSGSLSTTVGYDATKTLQLNPAVTYENRKLAKIHIAKIDSDTKLPLGGVQFEIKRISEQPVVSFLQGILPIDTWTVITDKDTGLADVTNLGPGTYVVTEKSAPAGYLLAPAQTIQLIAGQNAELTFANDPQSFLQLIKTDADTGKALDGAEFLLSRTQDFKEAKTVAVAAIGTQVTLVPGTWYVKESKAPAGYELNTSVYTVKLELGKTASVTVPDKLIIGALRLIKVDATNPQTTLPGAAFNIYADEARTKLAASGLTDAKGEINVSKLVPGTYWVVESSAPTGYKLDATPYSVAITANNLTVLTLQNTKDDTKEFNDEKAILKLLKVDGYSQKALEGAKFNLYSDSTLKTLVATGTSDTNGLIEFKDLTPGTYYVKETAAPKGYKLSTATIPVVTEAAKTSTMTITNELDDTKDYQTGSMDYNIMIGGGAALLLGMLLVLFTRRRKAVANHKHATYTKRRPKH